MKILRHRWFAIILAGFYGLLMRMIFGSQSDLFGFNLFSATFLFAVPIFIGSIPIIFYPADKEIPLSYGIWAPMGGVLVFFLLTLTARIEDILCTIVIAAPFMVIAMIGGILIRTVVNNRRSRKGGIYSLLLLPLLLSIVESKFETPTETRSYRNSVIINTTPDKIWPNIIRVKEISESEYNKGFLYYAGMPRPLYAELNKDTVGGTRIGHFAGGLRFIEKVSVWERNKKILFDITIDSTSINSSSIFDKHVLSGGHFHFINAYYELNPLGNNRTELSRTSSYELDTKINGYAALWGQHMLDDFQGRLLHVLKKRCDGL